MPLHPHVEWHAALSKLDGTQTLVVSWLSRPDSHRTSEGDPVLLGGISDRWNLMKDQVGGGINLSMFVKRSNSFVYWCRVTNQLVNYLNRAR